MLYFIDMTCMFHPFNSGHMLKGLGILMGKVVSKSFPGRGGVGWGVEGVILGAGWPSGYGIRHEIWWSPIQIPL